MLATASDGNSRYVRDLALIGLDALFPAEGGDQLLVPFARLLQLASARTSWSRSSASTGRAGS